MSRRQASKLGTWEFRSESEQRLRVRPRNVGRECVNARSVVYRYLSE